MFSIFRQPPLGATCGHHQQPADEETQFLRRNTERREKLHQKRLKVLQRGRAAGEPCDLGLPGPGQKHARRHAEIVERVAVSAVGRAAHGVGDVLVETGEEPETVLAGKGPTAVRARVRHGNTAGLAAQHRLALVDMHLKAALRQFMRRAETCNPSAENGHGLLHSVILRLQPAPQLGY